MSAALRIQLQPLLSQQLGWGSHAAHNAEDQAFMKVSVLDDLTNQTTASLLVFADAFL